MRPRSKMPGPISARDFVREVRDDLSSPTTSNFVSRIPQCRETVNKLEEVGKEKKTEMYSRIFGILTFAATPFRSLEKDLGAETSDKKGRGVFLLSSVLFPPPQKFCCCFCLLLCRRRLGSCYGGEEEDGPAFGSRVTQCVLPSPCILLSHFMRMQAERGGKGKKRRKDGEEDKRQEIPLRKPNFLTTQKCLL